MIGRGLLCGHQPCGRPALCGCSTRASGTRDGRFLFPPLSTRAGRARSAILDFCRQQPLGAISFVVIVVMMFAGIFAERVAPITRSISTSPASWRRPRGSTGAAPTRSAATSSSRIIYGSRPRW